MAEQRLVLKRSPGFSEAWVKKKETWAWNSLSLSKSVVKMAGLLMKMKDLRVQKQKSQISSKKKTQGRQEENRLQQ